MKIAYVPKNFTRAHLEIIGRAEALCTNYAAQGYDLTLRQLYYQFVSRGWIANKQTEYDRLGSIISDARLAGLIDWNHIVDRTRYVRVNSHWATPAGVIKSAASSYGNDLWAGQEYRPEVWIEKDALVGVIERPCKENDTPYFACRGYTSQSELWSAAMRLLDYTRRGMTPIVFHLGDHDPSGIDMTRDIEDRLNLFLNYHGARRQVEVRRLALNMDQVDQYSPPPNPAKTTDARFRSYAEIYGDESWELDALEPQVIADMIAQNIQSVRDDALWTERVTSQERGRESLLTVSERWDDVAHYAEELLEDDGDTLDARMRARLGGETRDVENGDDDGE